MKLLSSDDAKASRAMLERAKGCQKPHMPVSMGDALVKHHALTALAEAALLVLTATAWQVAVCRSRVHGAALWADQQRQR